LVSRPDEQDQVAGPTPDKEMLKKIRKMGVGRASALGPPYDAKNRDDRRPHLGIG